MISFMFFSTLKSLEVVLTRVPAEAYTRGQAEACTLVREEGYTRGQVAACTPDLMKIRIWQ